MRRWILIGGSVLGALILVVVIVLFFVVSSLDSLIKVAVEKYGSEITQVEVRLKEAQVSVTSGKGALRGLSIGNPAGFKTDTAFRLGEISLALDVGSVTGDPIVIKELVVAAPEVTYEIGTQGTNIDAIRRNVDASLGKGKDAGGKSTPSKGKGESGGPKLVIENVYIRSGKVNVSTPLAQDKKLSATLPDIHLTGIGKDKGGATSAEVVERLLGALAEGTTKAVSTLNLEGVMGTAKDAAGGVKGAVEEGTKGVGGAFKKLFGR